MCGEGKEKGIAIASVSRDQEGQSKLEYTEEKEGSSSSTSYHALLVAPEELLLVFGSLVPHTLPSKVWETCGCPVPAVVTIQDDVEMTMVPRENEEAIPVQVERHRVQLLFPHGSWSIQCDKTPWVMGHTTLYNGTNAPWVMGCTTVPAPHGSWVVQRC